jgi:site-specific recombinase XerD
MHRDASTIRGLYAWADAIGAVRENPAMLVCTPVVHNRQPRPVSDATFTKLWDVLDAADAIVLGLAFFGGLRREEITRLRVNIVDVGRRSPELRHRSGYERIRGVVIGRVSMRRPGRHR